MSYGVKEKSIFWRKYKHLRKSLLFGERKEIFIMLKKKVRNLKVYDIYNANYEKIPMLRLQGKWLRELGFYARVYMYITKPVMQVCGIIDLKRRIALAEWEKKYSYDDAIVQRIRKYRVKNNYAMPIKSYYETEALSLEELRGEFKGFFAPQFCYDLEKNELLRKFIEKKCVMTGIMINNEIDVEKENEICRDYMKKE